MPRPRKPRVWARWVAFPMEREAPPEPVPLTAVRGDGTTCDLRATLGERTGPPPPDDDYGVTWFPWPG
jgi:hypothetical protein